ncbi:MAG TPA: RdgB/HAM1 family non-canonical purine NTP pyrophosphatase [Gammaproteobacteria bacterium]|nr:RdgB/HAM1 family non-canonical purine NTP pyrophosphatase [Gammaproteobacteria bacterium]
MKRIVVATGNPGKLREISALLAGSGLEPVSQDALGVTGAEETGLTFVENALIKARHAAQVTGLPAIADDSGLEVDALDGAPGIHSARYAGARAGDAENLAKLLHALRAVPPALRGARFRCVMVYLRHAQDPAPLICEGVWEGRILDAPQGDNGFGYDPVFRVPERGMSAAQLSPEEKNRLSHRARALHKLVTALRVTAV